jgi:DNA-binding CsgD family transcriptional regulator
MVKPVDVMSQFPLHVDLTPRERDVIGQLLRGLSVAAGAAELGIAPSTARMHVKRLHEKTATTNLHSLVLWAVAHEDCCVQDK